jgi:DNA polymerase-3 subunit delta
LVLVVDAWLKTTRLYKRIAKIGYQIDCGPPKKSARSKSADPTKVNQWLIARAKQEYGFKLPKQGAQLLNDLTECEFGRMDQELQKIMLFADEQGQVSFETIKQSVGGWRTRTMWEAVDAALAGDAGRALDLLDLIFRGGEHPLSMFGSLSWSLRRYANATEEVLRQMRSGRKPNMVAAMKEAGLVGWGAQDAESNLKQIGSARARKLSQWLLEADAQLKRSHSVESRGRLVLEKLFVRLANELKA